MHHRYMMLKKFIISPPFGSYISQPNATSVLGTFTLERRRGKFLQVLKTLRYTKDGWVNKIGFRNPGLYSIESWDTNKIYSIFSNNDTFHHFIDYMPQNVMVELNLSCPNYEAKEKIIDIDPMYLLTLASRALPVIVKLPPTLTVKDMNLFYRFMGCGIKYFHLCNTIPVDRGGLSGKLLQLYTLPLIEMVKKEFPAAVIIGGGGIFTKEDVSRYSNAGADHFSLGTVWFTPWRALRLLRD